ncbi:MAG: ABC transporter permease [Deltaproteobacteria bacterium]|jgi:NitT/TauT family transport system permease protein|nr:ABC transporter permease [Deltaproteobacteria bacterium]
MKRTAEYYLIRPLGIAVFLCLWEILVRVDILDSQFVPPLSAVLEKMYELWQEGILFTNVMVSLWRAVVGLILACIVALPLGLLLGHSFKAAVDNFNPLLRILAQVNPFSLIPIFILFFGIGEIAKIAVVAWVCIWPVLFHTIEGARNVDPVLIKTARSVNTSGYALLRKVVLPAAAPSIFSGLRIGVEMSFFMLIAAEMIGATFGLGAFMHIAVMNMQLARMYAAAIAIVAVGVFFNLLLKSLQKRLFFWKADPLAVFTTQGDSGTLARGRPWRQGKLGALLALLLFVAILIIGAWQIQVAKEYQSNVHHRHHHEVNVPRME